MNDEYKKMLERFEQICQNAKKELCGEKEKEQVKEVIEQISYQEFYRYYQEKDTLIEQQEKEIKRLKERENILQKNFSDWKKGIEKERKYYLCERTDCCGRIKDSKKYSSLYQKNKRLNNIINELERYINEEYIYDELGMKIFDASKLQDKLQELKGNDKGE